MEQRVLFDSDSARNDFFGEVKSAGFGSWRELYSYCERRKSIMEKYRFGHLSLPKPMFDSLADFIPKKRREIFNGKISLIDGNWGRVKGGVETYKRHKEIFDSGRKLGSASPKKMISFDFNQPLSEGLCEFIGCFIGDGCAGNYGKQYLIDFAGDSRFDREYYFNTIIPIAKKFFNAKKACIKEKGNIFGARFYSKSLFGFLTQRFRLPSGVKFDKVMIPEEIINAGKEMRVACLRGIFDTDGCIFYDRRKAYKNPYMRITLEMHNESLIGQVSAELGRLGVKSKVLNDKNILQITSKENVKAFLETVGFSNPRHRNRIRAIYPELEKVTNCISAQ